MRGEISSQDFFSFFPVPTASCTSILWVLLTTHYRKRQTASQQPAGVAELTGRVPRGKCDEPRLCLVLAGWPEALGGHTWRELTVTRQQSCLQVRSGEVMGDVPTSFSVPSCEQLGAS